MAERQPIVVACQFTRRIFGPPFRQRERHDTCQSFAFAFAEERHFAGLRGGYGVDSGSQGNFPPVADFCLRGLAQSLLAKEGVGEIQKLVLPRQSHLRQLPAR